MGEMLDRLRNMLQDRQIRARLLRERLDAEAHPERAEIAALEARLAEAEERRDFYKKACARLNDAVCQTLGEALGYPKFADDPANFPGATEESGVFVGEHVAETLAEEAAARIGPNPPGIFVVSFLPRREEQYSGCRAECVHEEAFELRFFATEPEVVAYLIAEVEKHSDSERLHLLLARWEDVAASGRAAYSDHYATSGVGGIMCPGMWAGEGDLPYGLTERWERERDELEKRVRAAVLAGTEAAAKERYRLAREKKAAAEKARADALRAEEIKLRDGLIAKHGLPTKGD